ncbi:MAG: hypothetical protein AAF202_11715, partial [Pseudomonadota bacterium]
MKLARDLMYLCALCVLSYAPLALAQFDDAQEKKESNEVENLYDTFDKQETKRTKSKRIKQRNIPEPSRLADLATLEPFNDIAVIQRRFLPKTGRFEFSGSLMASVNNPFFSNLGFGARLAYYFNEKHGIVGQYYFLSNTERSVTSNLEEERGIETKSLTTPKNYAGLA